MKNIIPDIQMKRSIGTYMLIFFLFVFAGAIGVGGSSIYMVHRMMQKTYTIEEESKNVDLINHIHNKTYNLILAWHHFIIKPDEKYLRRATDLLAEIDKDLNRYIKYEEEESVNPEKNEELRLLRMMRENLTGVKGVVPIFEGISKNRKPDVESLIYLERYAYNIETLTEEINKLHFEIISEKVAKSRERLSSIFMLFVMFSGVGLILAFIGYWLHGRYIVKPIKVLAAATLKLSAGDLSTKVATASKTEIGALYHMFNTMTARLQANEKQLLEFNSALERKVSERTHELTNAYDSLKKAQSELVRLEKIATLGQIATSVNHEIKTPLNSLYMNLQLLKRTVNRFSRDSGHLHKDVNDMISVIDREALRISEILEEFIRFARFSPPDLKENDLNMTVRDVADRISERADDARVSLQLRLSDEIPRFMFDDKKIIQVLINLCVNALHAMPDGGTLAIETEGWDDSLVRLKVSDTGTGIHEADIGKIFQPFFSTKEAGLGLGLAIVRNIIEGHGGRISCRSRSGEGTSFEVLLPVAGGMAEAEAL